jgi:hypothetical protein
MIRTASPRLGISAILAVAYARLVAAVMAAALGHVNFAADDGLDVALAGFIEEIGSGEKIAVIGDGHRRHFLSGCFIQQLAGLTGAIEQTKIRVNVKVNKLGLTHGTRF